MKTLIKRFLLVLGFVTGAFLISAFLLGSFMAWLWSIKNGHFVACGLITIIVPSIVITFLWYCSEN